MISYENNESVLTITFDDGKANVWSKASAEALFEAFCKAEADEEARVVVFRGRPGKFSAGFDLGGFQSGDVQEARAQALAGFTLFTKLVSFPKPLVTVSEGHAIGMGAFILLAADTRIGLDEACKIGLPETALGMPLEPIMLAEVAKSRVNSNHFITAALQSKMYMPSEAVEAGFLDLAVSADALDATVAAVTTQLLALPSHQYTANKVLLKSDIIKKVTDNLKAITENPDSLFA